MTEDLNKREEQLQKRLEKLKSMEEEIKKKEKAIKDKEKTKKQMILRLSPGLWNEIAAWAFIDEKIRFEKIAQIVEKVMENEDEWNSPVRDTKDIFEADSLARSIAKKLV